MTIQNTHQEPLRPIDHFRARILQAASQTEEHDPGLKSCQML